jgi:hypothetical protein
VTQTQLQTSLAKVGAQIKTNSDAITTVSSRVSTQSELLTKEVAARKKETDQIKKDLNQTRQMAAILPLLSAPKSVQLAKGATDPATPAANQAPKALVESGDALSTLLPFLLLGGMGGSGGGGMFGSGGGDDSTMMLLVLALTLGKK